MDNPLSKLALDYWYQVLMVVCVVIFIMCGAGMLQAFQVAPAAMISGGGFFVGLGEWINHPLQTAIRLDQFDRATGIISGHPRKNSPIGICFVVGGLCLVFFGSFRALS